MALFQPQSDFTGSMSERPFALRRESDLRQGTERLRSIPDLQQALKREDPLAVIEAYTYAARQDPTLPADCLLPILFSIGGEPYTLNEHWAYAPLFRIFKRPKVTTVMAARQTGKTQNVSGQDVEKCALIPDYKQLNVTPLYEMSRRWSANYIGPLMDGCNVPGLTRDVDRARANASVLQRNFPNGSSIMFSFAYLDCERVRGIAAHELGIDEVQSMQTAFIPIIREVLSGSVLGFERYSGTPKTLDNPLHAALWSKSSQGHWMVWCEACNKENIFSEEFEMRDNIGKEGPICRYCGRPIDCKPRKAKAGQHESGFYVHNRPDVGWYHTGYHIPQIVHPRHTDYPHKWVDLRRKAENMKESQFDNECLAISSDVGTKLVTADQLASCSAHGAWTLDQIRDRRHEFKYLVTATDWSGKGKKRNASRVTEETELEFASYTAIAVVGLRHGTEIPEVLWLNRLPYDTDYAKEAALSVDAWIMSGSHIYAHDFTGAGSVKEVLAKQYGFDRGMRESDIMPLLYTNLGPAKPIIHFDNNPNDVQYYYSMDKHRALMLMALLIQKGKLPVPNREDPAPNGKEKYGDLLDDWLALFEETSDTARGKKSVMIQRDPDRPDDVAQAMTMGCCAIWHMAGWPDLAQYVTNYMAATQHYSEESSPELGQVPDWNGSLNS